MVQGGLIRAAMPRLGEKRAVFFGYTMMSFGFLGFALATLGAWLALLVAGAAIAHRRLTAS